VTDPLAAADNVSPTQHNLFKELVASAKGQESGDVIGAAVNLIINVIRQVHDSRRGAERAYDDVMGLGKRLLLEKHYYNDGRRRNIFPHTQRLEAAEVFVNQSRLNGKG